MSHHYVEPGTLYLVSTPIGNLDDITLRACEVLKHVDGIAAEDTRTSSVLLKHHHINTPVTPHHDFNKEKVAPRLLERLASGEALAVISDAGTPGISDPAFYLVREAIRAGITIVPIPGPAALLPALIVSGLPTDRFVFEGFLPVKKGRKTRLELLTEEPRTIVLYESPHRIHRTLKDLFEVMGERQAAVVREITKKFEEVVRAPLSELVASPERITLKGEFVLVVEGLTRERKKNRKQNVI